MSEGRQTRRDVLVAGGSMLLSISNGCLGLQEDGATATTTGTTTATQSLSETATQTRTKSAEPETETETETEEPPSRIGEWEIQFDSPLVEKPMLRNGRVVVFTERGVYGMDRQLGELVYAHDLVSNGDSTTSDRSILLGNRVHPDSGDSTDLSVVNPQDGAISTVTLPHKMICETTNPEGSTVYGYRTDPEELLAINIESQTEAWSDSQVEHNYSLTLQYTAGRLLLIKHYGDSDNGGAAIFGYDIQTGEQVWEHRFQGKSGVSQRYEFTATGEIFVLTFAGGRILMLKATDGSVQWDTTHSPSDDQVPANPLVAEGGGIYLQAGSTEASLLKLSPSSGQKIWSVQPSRGSSLVGEPTFVGEYVLQNSYGGTVTLNRSSGEVVNRRLMDGTVISSGRYGNAETIDPETGLTLGESLVFFGISGNRVVAAPRQEFGI